MKKKLIYIICSLVIVFCSLSIVRSVRATQAVGSVYNILLLGDTNQMTYNFPEFWYDVTNHTLNIGGVGAGSGVLKFLGTSSGSTSITSSATGVITIGNSPVLTTPLLNTPTINGRIVDAVADVPLTATQCGSTVLLDKNNGLTVTLPAPVTGCYFNFINAIAYSSGTITVVTNAGTVFILGTTQLVIEATATPKPFTCNGSSHIKIAENGTTTGGIIGGQFALQNISATQWVVLHSTILGSGAIATPCST